MRISTSFQYDNSINRVRESQARMFALQNQVMTGKRFTNASEDPLGTSHVMTATSYKNRIEQLQKNLTSAKEYLGNSEVVMGEVSSLLRSAYAMAIQGASAAVDTDARAAMSQEIELMQRRMVELANTQGSQGQYIFAGHLANTKPFANSPPNINFLGDQNAILVEIRPAEVMVVNLTGARDLFTDAYNAMERMQNNMLSGNINLLSSESIPELQRSLNQFTTTRGDLGAKVKSLDEVAAQNTRRLDDLTEDISDISEVDLASALTKYQEAETAYTASLQMTSRGFQLSLMDFLR